MENFIHNLALAVFIAGTLKSLWFFFLLFLAGIKHKEIKDITLSPLDWKTFGFLVVYFLSFLMII